MDIKNRCDELIRKGMSVSQIKKALMKEYKKKYNVSARKYYLKNKAKKKPRLVFSDTHFPYQRKGYLKFLKDVHEKFNCDEEVICLGDLVDHHAISRHDSHPDAVGDVTEHNLAQDECHKLFEAFPKGIITFGNHDKIPERQAATLGLSSRYLKSFRELWHFPKGWKIVEEIEIDKVHYSHGIGNSGWAGSIRKAMREGVSSCIGHYHSFGGVLFFANKHRMIFGANSGCLCDPDSLAMAYGKYARFRPTIGCLIVHNDRRCEFIPMHLEKYKEVEI